jgi:nitrite reductase/ring-hydroxylating ferredoxin subunit
VLRGRRLRGRRLDEETAALLRIAFDLLASRRWPPPREAFVERLRRRVRRRQAPRPVPGSPRRRRVRAAAALTAATGAGAVTARALRTAGGDPGPGCAHGAWQAVADAADLPEDGVVAFDLATVAGFVRRRAGRLTAVSGYCTHQGCRLAVCDTGRRLVCPCHGAEFTLAGVPLEPLHGTRALAPLPRLAVRVDGGRVEVWAPVLTSATPAEPGAAPVPFTGKSD